MNGAIGRLRVLVIEDEGLVSMLIEDMLIEFGHEIAAVTGRMQDAIRAAQTASFDLAIVDVSLDGAPSYPVAEIIKARRIPFAFVTGYGLSGLDPRYAGWPTLQKPFTQPELAEVLLEAWRSESSDNTRERDER